MYKSNLPQVESRMRAASFAGLEAAAAVYENAVKDELRGGYTSGDFVTGQSVSAVAHSEPEMDSDGAFILVGTSLLHNLYWELGHQNLFTRRFERVEKWVPTFYRTREQQLAAFQRVYLRFMGGGAGGFGSRAASLRSPR
jgi:hypothetical protein